MRYFLLFLFAASFTSCIAPKKVDALKASYDRELARADSLSAVQSADLNRQTKEIYRLEGANEALLEAQSRLEDKLVKQKLQLDDLSGNLSSTNTRLQDRISKLQAEVAAGQASRDSLVNSTRALTDKFQELAVDAQNTILESLDSLIPADSYTLTQGAGELVFSVQEDVLFQSKSTSRLQEVSAYVFRAVRNALDDDPLLKLTIVGHTDNRPAGRNGTDNWQFAALRAATLADHLTKNYFVSPNRIVAASQGEFRPLASNADEDGRRRNRRIDFVLRGAVSNLLRELGRLEK